MDRIKFLELIGEGSLGTVHLAVEETTGREIIVKRLPTVRCRGFNLDEKAESLISLH